MKILFIMPKFNKGQGLIYDPNDNTPDYNYLIPIGMPYIAAYLKQNGYKDVHGINLNHHCGTVEQQVKEAVSKIHYDVIFTGGLSAAFLEIRDIVRFIREVSPATIVVVGGGLISSEPEVVMPLIKPDFGIIFEGEETALELINWLSHCPDPIDDKEINGLAFFNIDGKLHISPKREPIKDLDRLPFPDLDMFDYEEYICNQYTGSWNLYSRDHNPRPYVLVGSRGCIAACTFCFHTTGPKYYQRSIESIMQEVRYAVEKYKINFFTFQDELFAYDKPRALEFCRQFGEYISTLPCMVEMYCNLRVDCADKEILDAMKKAGNTVIGLGLESMSPVVLNSMRKHITPEQTKRCFELIAGNQQVPQGVFIFGDPAETLETAKVTIDFIRDNPHLTRGGVFIGFIIPFPGTKIYRDAVKSGLIPDEAQFIEDLCSKGYGPERTMNFTKLSPNNFEKLKNMVYTAVDSLKPYAVPSIIESLDGKVGVWVTCPHCGRLQHYLNTGDPNLTYVPIICQNPNCKGRFDIVCQRFAIAKWLIKTFGFNRVWWIRKLKQDAGKIKKQILG
jgi:anaerobic magnesium-protoporphyrin IX monomethyl ester cyclase